MTKTESLMFTTHRTIRRGFTLVEIMIVIVILSILIALTLPAIQGAMRNARDARVKNEISGLESAIAAFKSTYGCEPPSRIRLYEMAADGTPKLATTPATDWDDLEPICVSSRAAIRRIWPQFNFALARDINGDGDMTDNISMNAGECLLFFLGGIVDNDTTVSTSGLPHRPPAEGGTGTLTGFSKNPTNPLVRGGNREGPFFEFDLARVVDTDSPKNYSYEYLDSLPGQTNPLLYFSSYEGQGYRTEWRLSPGTTATVPSTISSLIEIGPNRPIAGLTNVYMATNATGTSASAAQKPESFQIISPGDDGQYGTGGIYGTSTAETDLGAARMAEWDNITNFSQGRLLSK